MKFIVSVILIILLSFSACLYFPWWSVAVVAFIVAVAIPQPPVQSFVTGFIALFILWLALTYWISNSNGHLLAHKVSLIILKADSPYLLMLLSALIGAVIAGFAATAGSCLRKSFVQPNL